MEISSFILCFGDRRMKGVKHGKGKREREGNGI